MVLELSKKVYFLQFCAEFSKKSKLQFTYMHLKSLVMHFKEMVLFIMLWVTVSDILGFEAKELYQISAESTSFLIF